MSKPFISALLISVSISLLAGCGNTASPATDAPTTSSISSNTPEPTQATSASPSPKTSVSPLPSVSPAATAKGTKSPTDSPNAKPTATPATTVKGEKNDDVQAVAKPDSITALVNKKLVLSENYEPNDLVYPDVLFTFKEKIEKRKMRKEAAEALKQLFDGAKEDGIHLAGVSAYRSYSTQKTLFNNYVKKDGLEKAKTYSAVPGQSEHQTGLSIDVTGSDGKCAVQDCFGGTKEAVWLAKHSAEYGFIIRYPEGKESITGYQYEPWHIRYVGTSVSKEIAAKNITMEEYYNAVPVTK
ncbi:D-alanyl-D-alanine carboxypeptidase [compost metagenome]